MATADAVSRVAARAMRLKMLFAMKGSPESMGHVWITAEPRIWLTAQTLNVKNIYANCNRIHTTQRSASRSGTVKGST